MLKFIKNAFKGQNSVSFQSTTIVIMLLTVTSGYVVNFSWSLLALTGFMYAITIGVDGEELNNNHHLAPASPRLS